MPWFLLLSSAVLEAIWATALGYSEGLRRPAPTIVFAAALTLSMLGLGQAMKRIPLATAYAVWVALGAALTAGYAVLTGAEPMSAAKAVFLAGIIGSAIGLKMLPDPPGSQREERPRHPEAEVPGSRNQQ